MMNYKTQDGKYRVDFQGGECRIGNNECNYMLTEIEVDDETIELYAEVPVSDFEYDGEFDVMAFDEYSYPLLKEEIINQAKENEINPEILEFYWD